MGLEISIRPHERGTQATLSLRRGRARVRVKSLAACGVHSPPIPIFPRAGRKEHGPAAERRALFRLHHIDPVPIGGGRGCQELLAPLNVELTWRVVRHFLEHFLKESDGFPHGWAL